MTAHRVGYRRSLVSQSTSMQFTPSKTIGGRAWISIQLANTRVEKALVIWANTTLGLLLNWWHANKQQSGRGSVGKSSLQYLPIFDVSTLSSIQLTEVEKIFDEMKDRELKAIHLIDTDTVREYKSDSPQVISLQIECGKSLFSVITAAFRSG